MDCSGHHQPFEPVGLRIQSTRMLTDNLAMTRAVPDQDRVYTCERMSAVRLNRLHLTLLVLPPQPQMPHQFPPTSSEPLLKVVYEWISSRAQSYYY